MCCLSHLSSDVSRDIWAPCMWLFTKPPPLKPPSGRKEKKVRNALLGLPTWLFQSTAWACLCCFAKVWNNEDDRSSVQKSVGKLVWAPMFLLKTILQSKFPRAETSCPCVSLTAPSDWIITWGLYASYHSVLYFSFPSVCWERFLPGCSGFSAPEKVWSRGRGGSLSNHESSPLLKKTHTKKTPLTTERAMGREKHRTKPMVPFCRVSKWKTVLLLALSLGKQTWPGCDLLSLDCGTRWKTYLTVI